MPRNGYKIFLGKIFLEKATRESRIYDYSKISKNKKKKEKDIKPNLMEIKRLIKTQFPLSQSALYQTYQEKKLEISFKKNNISI